MRKITLAVLLAVIAPALHAQSAYLVKDLNDTVNLNATSSGPKEFFRHGSRIYFAASTPATGLELFTTDGTEAGTALVANIFPTPTGSSPSRFTNVNGNLVFNARDTRGEELWTTDGTAAGTRLMADINTGAPSSSPGDRIVYKGQMIFAAHETVYGRELWITDGTSAGTRFFKDLEPGAGSSDPQSFVQLGDAVYFSAADAIWKTDGTEAGTVRVKSGVFAYNLAVAGSRVFFAAYADGKGPDSWVSDGTEAGTFRLLDAGPDRNGSLSSAFVPLGDRVLFVAYERERGSEWWISDGTAAGTHLLRDIEPGPVGSSHAAGMTVLGNIAIFAARTPEHGWELWRTDGTTAGTVLLRDLLPGPDSSGPGAFVTVGSSVYFATGEIDGARIWVTDGTADGTRPVTPAGTGFSIYAPFHVIDGTLYFSGANTLNGFEPWKSDGTAAGTVMIANLAHDSAPSSDATPLKAAGDWLYFDAWDGRHRPTSSNNYDSLWRTDGTAEGTVQLTDGVASDYRYTAVGRTVLFSRGSTLWISDGTPAGTKPATEFVSRFPDTPHVLFAIHETIVVSVDEKMWATRLAPGSPVVPLDSDGWIGFAALAGRAVYFSRDAGPFDWQLWITDGTPAGTFVVASIPERPDSGPVVMGGHVYFTTDDDGPRLWRSDGTADGTVVVAPLPEAGSHLVAAGNKVFFTDNRDGNLWVSDGTAAGTRELPVQPYLDVTGTELAAAGDRVVFVANDATNGYELWVSDGTAEGTRVLLDINPGALNSGVEYLTTVGGSVYFSAYSQLTGTELWVTDGTTAGTKLAADVEPGPGSSYPRSFVLAGERLFFTATHSATGSELWALPLAPRIAIRDARVAETESATARFTVTLSAASAQTVTVDYATSNGTAEAGVDYDATSGKLTFAPHETSKTIDVRVRGDAAVETNETFLVTLSNASGAPLDMTIAAGIIEDDDQSADVSLVLDYTHLQSSTVEVLVKNAGPATATNLRPRLTVTPASTAAYPCQVCRITRVAVGATAEAFSLRDIDVQRYFTATVTARERDPNPANNTIGWTVRSAMAMDALHLTPGSQANVWLALFFQGTTTLTLESSNPAVVSVPASVTLSGGAPSTFLARGIGVGTATIRAVGPGGTFGTLDIEVLAPGTQQRWPTGMQVWLDNAFVRFDQDLVLRLDSQGTAPFTGATPTGAVTVSANGRELARVNLTPDSRLERTAFHAPAIGRTPLTVHYAGDANFLPMTYSTEIEVTRGFTTVHATATRNGANVVVRVRVIGSPVATPTGTVAIGTMQVPLVAIGPGIAEAEVTRNDIAAGTTTLNVRYSGDERYVPTEQNVRITEDRRRTIRH